MTFYRAVLWIDHHHARLLKFDAEQSQLQQVHAHTHNTRQHGSAVRTEHEFFGEVCDALGADIRLLVTGSHQAQADLRHYLAKHRPAVAPQVIGWQTVDHPTDGQLLAQARSFFDQHERLASGPATT